MNLEDEVRISFAGIINTYGFNLKVMGVSEIALIKGKFALWFFYYYRDGVSVSYIVKNKDGSAHDYSICDYLRFRRKRFFSPENSACDDTHILRSLALTLEKSAQDILLGDEEWLVDYKTHYSVTPLAQITTDKIWDVTSQE